MVIALWGPWSLGKFNPAKFWNMLTLGNMRLIDPFWNRATNLRAQKGEAHTGRAGVFYFGYFSVCRLSVSAKHLLTH